MKHTDIADFDDNGNVIQLNIDWKDFEVSFTSYFNGDANLSTEEWERVFFYVNNLLTEDYIIASLGDRYKVTTKPIHIPTEDELKQQEIEELKENLEKTDYVVIKIAEGVATPEEYADVIEQRQQWRARINELEA